MWSSRKFKGWYPNGLLTVPNFWLIIIYRLLLKDMFFLTDTYFLCIYR
jgi:hypothetical protein